MSTITNEACIACIRLVFFDDTTDEVVTIGGAGFLTENEFDAAWESVPVFRGESSFQAEHQDEDGDIIGEKTVSAETCEKLTGKPIATLIAEGRAKLAAELDEYRKAV